MSSPIRGRALAAGGVVVGALVLVAERPDRQPNRGALLDLLATGDTDRTNRGVKVYLQLIS